MRSSKRKSNSKWYLLFSILTLSVLTAFIFTSSVFSSSELNMKIVFGSETWDLSEESSFDKEWVTNDSISFKVDLSSYYSKLADGETGEQPFDVESSYKKEAITVQKVKDDSGVFNGIYNVSVDTNAITDGEVDFQLNINGTNNWEIPADKNPIEFSVKKDTTEPVINYSGIDDQAVYHASKTLSVNIVEQNIASKSITWKHNGQAVEPSINWDGNKAKVSFKEDGDYSLTINAKDKAGLSAEETLTFHIHQEEPEWSVKTSSGDTVKSGSVLHAREFNFTVKNGIAIDSANLVIKKAGTTIDEKDMTVSGKTATVDHTFTENGRYTIEAKLTDKLGGKEHALQTFNVTVDDANPEVTITNDDGQDIEDDKVYQQPFSVLLNVLEPNLDVAASTITVKHVYFDNEVSIDVPLSYKNGKATATYKVEDEGEYTLSGTLVDKAGNEIKINKTFTLLTSSNLVNITDKTNHGSLQAYYQNDILLGINFWDFKLGGEFFTVTKTDPLTGEQEIYLNSDDLKGVGWFFWINEEFGEGQYDLNIETQHINGTKEIINRKFIIDKTDPKVVLNTSNQDMKIGENQHVKSSFVTKHGIANIFPISVSDAYLDDYHVQVQFADNNGKEKSWVYDKPSDWETKEKAKHFTLENKLFEKEGKYTISVRATDDAGRSTEKSRTFTIDDTAPVIKLSDVDRYNDEAFTQEVTVEEHNYQDNNVKITVEREDSEGEYHPYKSDKFDEWENTGVTSNAKFPIEEDGTYRLRVSATDKAGNKAKEVEAIFTLDSAQPESLISGVEDDHHYSDSKPVTVSVKDNNIDEDLTNLEVNKWSEESDQFEALGIDTELVFDKKEAEWKYKFEEEGTYQIILEATDLAGRKAKTQEVVFTIDETPPVVSVDSLKNQEYYSKAQKVTFSVDELNYQENSVEFEVLKDGKDFTDQVEGDNGSKWRNKGKQSSLIYNFDQDGDYQVTFSATDKAGNKSEKIHKIFTIDETLPSVSINGIDNGTHYTVNKEVTLAVNDTNITEYDLNITKDSKTLDDLSKTGSENFNDSITFSDEGDYVITLIASDEAKNEAVMEKSFTIDKTSPVISIDHSMPSFVKWSDIKDKDITKLIPIKLTEKNVKNKSITITVVDNNGKKKTYNDNESGTWKEKPEGHYQYILKKDLFKDDGDYTIEVVAKDKAKQETKESISFTVDNTKPVITLTDLAPFNKEHKTEVVTVNEHNYFNNDVTIKIYRENAQGNFVPYNDGFDNWKNNGETSKLAFRFEKDGKYKVEVSATDKAGNEADAKVDIFTIDTVKPQISITGVTDNQHYRTSKKVKVDVDDANVSQKKTELKIYKLNHSTGKMEAYNTGKAPSFSRRTMDWEYNFTSEGTYRVQIKSTDMAGNKGETQTKDFTVDKTAPALAINNVKDGQYYNNGRSAEFTIEETNFARNTVQFQVTKDGQDITNAVEGNRGASWRTSNFLSKLRYSFSQDGAYHVRMNATDDAGNKARTAQKGFVIDSKKPVIDITGVEDGEYYNTDVPVGVTIKDVNFDLNTIRVTRNGQNYPVGGFAITNNRYQNSIASFAHRFTQEGDYEIFVESVDKANNGDTATLSFTIDKTKPVITPIMGGDNKELVDGSYINHVFQPIFQLDNEEDKIVSVRLNNGGNIAGNVPLASKEMKYGYEVVAQDKAGNETTLNVGFTLDTTKPKLSITGIIEGFFNKDIRPQVEYSDKHLDEKRTSVTLNGAAFKNGLQLTEERDYVLKALITDLADNVSERTIVFTIDKTAPKIVFNEEISGKYLNDVVIPELLIDDMTAYDIIALTLNGEPYELGDPIESEGKHVLYFEVRDQAGNIQQLTIEFIIDQTEPEVIFDGAEENKEYVEAVDLSIQLDNPQDKIKSITVNGEAYDGDVSEQDGNEVVQYHFSEINKYNVEVTAYDEAGNEVTRSLPFEITEKSVLTKFYENKPLFSVSIAGVAALLLAILFALVRSRKGKKAAEE
ncbi:Ig-like domain-containing protein [Gracilibacillus dipsosauri]|uniref:PKD/Chitinase domain-containing protein n=1 Tax=Gracilibacillus dipsosauri TaxID=178340 RepID=A0A317L362_9BACI|nr:Ig-like domain-containing protein [Gracilibacillus dipsosauri]PWU69440.1 hypothetical protein DLJ74_05555 [Gracilibacillus dipsosauri]